MTQKIVFSKMHGAGNDYIYVDTSLYNIADPVAAARKWSDRHKGVGSDGLVLVERTDEAGADFAMRIFNADGSEAAMCGNACRCLGKYLYEKGMTRKTEIGLLTLSGVRILKLRLGAANCVESVTVDMGEPVFENPMQFRPQGDDLQGGIFVSMGNPHYVTFVEDVDEVEVRGQELEHHPAFPQRANVEFAVMRPDGIRVRVWERGSGITQACGTGACAVAVAACRTGRGGRSSSIVMDGGRLEVEWCQEDNHVYLTGSAEFVFEGEMEMS